MSDVRERLKEATEKGTLYPGFPQSTLLVLRESRTLIEELEQELAVEEALHLAPQPKDAQ